MSLRYRPVDADLLEVDPAGILKAFAAAFGIGSAGVAALCALASWASGC